MGKYIVALDQGTTSSRAIVFDELGQIVAVSNREVEQIYPQPGWKMCIRDRFNTMARMNTPILTMRPMDMTLEDIFLQLTNEDKGAN